MYLSCPALVFFRALLIFAIAAVLGGVPLIGPVPGVEGLMLATGHEGSGLCMVYFLFYCMYISYVQLYHTPFTSMWISYVHMHLSCVTNSFYLFIF